MIYLLMNGQVSVFILILIAIIISLTFHEWGHARAAKYFGDNTAEQMGRLTLNPAAHIDPLGLLMVAVVGFGFAKPVPTNPRNFRVHWADFYVAAAGPLMNLVLAIFFANLYTLGLKMGWEFFYGEGQQIFFSYLVIINIVLMLFNLIPLGPLDGHYIFPYFLPKDMAYRYRILNAQYGSLLLMGLVVLSIVGVPIFRFIMSIGQSIMPYLVFV
ncbi:MAG: site-2 protease family protein, partial [Pseudomonadota bacterium]